jgi:YD repeat-containing protein
LRAWFYPNASTEALTYDADDNVLTRTTRASQTITSTYDTLNNLVTRTWTPVQAQAPPSASTTSFAYTYNAANQRMTQTTTDNAYWSYPASPASVA